MSEHLTRVNLAHECPVCKAEPFKPCIMGNQDKPANETEEAEYLIAEIVRGINALRELRPNHPLVVGFTAILSLAKPDQ